MYAELSITLHESPYKSTCLGVLRYQNAVCVSLTHPAMENVIRGACYNGGALHRGKPGLPLDLITSKRTSSMSNHLKGIGSKSFKELQNRWFLKLD